MILTSVNKSIYVAKNDATRNVVQLERYIVT